MPEPEPEPVPGPGPTLPTSNGSVGWQTLKLSAVNAPLLVDSTWRTPLVVSTSRRYWAPAGSASVNEPSLRTVAAVVT